MNMKPAIKVIITAFILVILVIGFYFATKTISAATGKSILGWVISGISELGSEGTPENLDDFAKCLTEQGAKMYGASWCGHCQNQKEMFGNSFQYVDYVECTETPEICSQAGIQGYPTWMINGQLYPGEASISKLSSLSGC